MKNQRIVLISLAAGIIIVILVALLGVLLAKKPLNLENLDQVDSGLTSSEVTDLEKYIWESLQRTQGFSDNQVEIVALIRPSSFSKVTNDNITNYNFLIDIDEFKATYLVSFALMGNKGFYESPMIDCPTPELMKYPETYCKGEKTSTTTVTIGRSLPYYFNLSSGELVTVTLGKTEANEEVLNVRVSSCGNETIVAETREKVNAWIESLGYEPSNYNIEILEFCDGAGN
ncbi:MAG: hypothetical protein K6G49_01860 [Candidatus Saccharibacteria bacterium]|nr:hypothetical protein [Candidatus Saccharibacteria bacterium]